MLEITNLSAAYGHLQVLWNVSIAISEGEFIALIGPNGAGKTTTLNTIVGLVEPVGGKIELMGVPMVGRSTYEISRMGISLVPQELNLFSGMSVADNLILGAYAIRSDKEKVRKALDFVFDLFPKLADRKEQSAGTLSGGERKMLALGRGLMSEPKVLLVDEPSLGLAPLLVRSVFEALQELNRRGMTILLVEQNVRATLQMTSRGYVLEQGRILLAGTSSDLLEGEHVRKAYLGL